MEEIRLYNSKDTPWFVTALSGFKLFLKSSRYSLIFVAVIAVLLNFIGQGGILFVDLLDGNILDLALFFLLSHAFSLVITHYPSYLRKWHQTTGDLDGSSVDLDEKWEMNLNVLGSGLGMITFHENISPGSYINRIRRWSDAFRGMLGPAYYLAFIYVSISIGNKYLIGHVDESSSTSFFPPLLIAVILIAAIILYVGMVLLKVRIEKSELAEHEISAHKKSLLSKRKRRLTTWKRVFNVLFWFGILSTIMTLWSSYTYGWSKLTFSLFFTTECITLYGVILFRFVRNRFAQDERWAFPFNVLRIHLNYILSMTTVGWLSVLLVIIAHFVYGAINPIVLIIAIFNIVYGAIIVPTKHYFYYTYIHRNGIPADANLWSRILSKGFRYLVPIGFFIVLFLVGIMNISGNGLHKIARVDPEAGEIVRESEYHDALVNKLTKLEPQEPVYFISSYGGGLMANYWNLLVLETLRDCEGQDIVSHTVAMSGVSGGALGQAFYLGMMDLNPEERMHRISRMGSSNPLSVDLAYTFGWDMLRELFFWKEDFRTLDRAGRVMKEYALEQGDSSLNSQSFYGFWSDRFRHERAGLFPILLSNSTGLSNTRGIACSVALDDFSSVFPNAQDILTAGPDNKTPTYLGAVSCSNRFPILSPAARVPGHGHFLDGGYFENSGLLTLTDFSAHLAPMLDSLNVPVTYIQIVNSKSAYIRYLLRKSSITVQFSEKETSENTAVISALSGIDILPRYLEESDFPETYSYVQIHLPYEISLEDLDELFNGVVVPSPELKNMIEENNAELGKIIFPNGDRSQSCEPQLARLLSAKTTHYMQSVVASDWFLESLRNDLRKEPPTMINVQAKSNIIAK